MEGWVMTQAGTRYGCFLPDLTGLARSLSIPAFHPHATRAGQWHATGRTPASKARRARPGIVRA